MDGLIVSEPIGFAKRYGFAPGQLKNLRTLNYQKEKHSRISVSEKRPRS